MKTFTLPAILLALCIMLQSAAYSAGIQEADRDADYPWPGLEATSVLADEDMPELDGKAVLLYDRDNDMLICGRNLDERLYPASLTKVMTCLLALEYGGFNDTVTVTESALAMMDPDGSSADLRVGEQYTLEQLLYCLMVKSANDAALVIAEYLGGSVNGFVWRMNERAAELGCTGTHFTSPHGMHDEDHYSTARDLARITMAALEYDLFPVLWGTDSYTLPKTEAREERILYSTNYLTSILVTNEYYDSRVTGGKTGFTTPAGRCVICTAYADEHRYLAVVLGASSTDSMGKMIYGGFTTVSAMLDWVSNFDVEAYRAAKIEARDRVTVWTLSPLATAWLIRRQNQDGRSLPHRQVITVQSRHERFEENQTETE